MPRRIRLVHSRHRAMALLHQDRGRGFRADLHMCHRESGCAETEWKEVMKFLKPISAAVLLSSAVMRGNLVA